MSNPYFQFKEFIIYQHLGGLKVCTDACLFGALIEIENTRTSVLDIGTGTGLLSLMLAQKYGQAQFTAVEIQQEAAQQAGENFQASPWKERIQLEVADITDFALKSTKKFDVVVSNPPFFQNSIRNTNEQKNIAVHGDTLSLKELAESVEKVSHTDSDFWVLLPPYESELLAQELKLLKWYCHKKIVINNFAHKEPFREVRLYRKDTNILLTSAIAIYKKPNQYTEEFIELLKPYYLYL